MSSFRPELLDDPQALLATDRGGLLRALAGSGAQVRRATQLTGEFGVERLRADSAPRALLVATDANAQCLPDLLAALASSAAPVLDWPDASLPPWAGPADALLVVSLDGRHPRLAELTAVADRRGLAVAVAAPRDSPVAAAARRHPVADLAHLGATPARASWWALAAPALQALDALGLADAGPLMDEVADALDAVAETERPDSSSVTGAAKLLAGELAESTPLVAGIGPIATVAAGRIAATIQLFAGVPALAARLPDDAARLGALLEFAAGPSDIFADEPEQSRLRPRLLLVGDDNPLGARPDPVREGLGEAAGRRAADALRELAGGRGLGVSRLLAPDAPALVRFAVATATADFAACYLALASGVDPGAPRLGEPAL